MVRKVSGYEFLNFYELSRKGTYPSYIKLQSKSQKKWLHQTRWTLCLPHLPCPISCPTHHSCPACILECCWYLFKIDNGTELLIIILGKINLHMFDSKLKKIDGLPLCSFKNKIYKYIRIDDIHCELYNNNTNHCVFLAT